jgi:hypothetical protein
MDETEVLLRILEFGQKEIEAGNTVPIEKVIEEFCNRNKSPAATDQSLTNTHPTVG